MQIEILDKRQAADAGFDVPDIYYLPAYGSTAELIDDGTWECAIAEGGRFVFPYIRRRIPIKTGEWDLVSPYGYGGPVAPNDEERARFRTAFFEQARRRGCVAEFLRTNPFDISNPDTAGLKVDSWRRHTTFVIDLDRGVDEYWRQCAGRHRTAVRKSAKSGVTVRPTDASKLADSESSFRRLYRQTMDRVGASSRLKLPDEYFQLMVSGLADQISVIEASSETEVMAAAVFMRWGTRLHYHLSASSGDGMRVGATNAILDYAVRELVPKGGVLHLGGGVSAGDGLEAFKRSIASRDTSVFLCSTVINEQRYSELVQELGGEPSSAYFPAYRS